ncbi:MAG: hypothetical protein ACRDQE_05715 [Gaiellales bacterium]
MRRRLALVLPLLAAALAPQAARAALFHDDFNVRPGLLTNEYRYWNHLPSRDRRWQMTRAPTRSATCGWAST